jgi:hypothetical protein
MNVFRVVFGSVNEVLRKHELKSQQKSSRGSVKLLWIGAIDK